MAYYRRRAQLPRVGSGGAKGVQICAAAAAFCLWLPYPCGSCRPALAAATLRLHWALLRLALLAQRGCAVGVVAKGGGGARLATRSPDAASPLSSARSACCAAHRSLALLLKGGAGRGGLCGRAGVPLREDRHARWAVAAAQQHAPPTSRPPAGARGPISVPGGTPWRGRPAPPLRLEAEGRYMAASAARQPATELQNYRTATPCEGPRGLRFDP